MLERLNNRTKMDDGMTELMFDNDRPVSFSDEVLF